MAKASQPKDIKPEENIVDLTKIINGMKRNFSRYMTKLGAHITHLSIYWANNVSKIAKKGFNRISSWALSKMLRIIAKLISSKNKISTKFSLAQNYFYDLEDSLEDVSVNEGFFPAAKLCVSSISRGIWSLRGGFVTVFNWAVPVVSIVFLVNVVTYASNLSYGISVECNGEKLGVITEETEYDEAEMALQQRITYVEGNEKVVITPKLSLQIVYDAKEIVKPSQLADKMIVNSDADLANAYGLYIDGQFIGALTDRKPVMNTLSNIMSNYQSPDVKSINFKKSVEYKQGLYLKSSIVSSDKVIQLLTSNTQVDAYYTIQESDTPLKIASKNGITLAQLVSLNPNIQSDCDIGDKVLLNRAEPYMPVQIVKDVQYTDTIDYETLKVETSSMYKGNEKVTVEGEEGEATITAEVTYMNGYEVGRTITGSVVTKQPVSKKISVGTKTPQPTKGTQISGNGQYAWPVAGGYISAYFGDGRGHKGIDIAASAGTSIFAAESGTVILAQWYYGYGNCIMIQQADGNVTVYGHESKLLVSYGQKVQKGELIGLVGRSGDATGNHLHFEVRKNGRYLNPITYVQ